MNELCKIDLSKIRYDFNKFNFKTIKEKVKNKEIKFTKENQWDIRKQTYFIESILLGLPLQYLFFKEKSDATLEILDGNKRIKTFIDFMNDEFPLQHTYFIKLKNFKFSDLDALLQRKIEDYQIATYIIQPPTPEDVILYMIENNII